MTPTLVTQEHVIGLRQQSVRRFDIITFDAPDQKNKQYVKRVIALPGETVDYQNGELKINGQKVIEPYLESTTSTNAGPSCLNYTVPAGHYFVMGDNRKISKESIIGQVSYIYWPPNKVGAVQSYKIREAGFQK